MEYEKKKEIVSDLRRAVCNIQDPPPIHMLPNAPTRFDASTGTLYNLEIIPDRTEAEAAIKYLEQKIACKHKSNTEESRKDIAYCELAIRCIKSQFNI